MCFGRISGQGTLAPKTSKKKMYYCRKNNLVGKIAKRRCYCSKADFEGDIVRHCSKTIILL
jgi:hypothetical protein